MSVQSGEKPTKNYTDGTRIDFEIIEGKRRGSKLLHSISEKQLYFRNKTLANASISYRCQSRNCAARVYVVGEKCYLSEPCINHNHVDKEREISEMKIHSQLKVDCEMATSSQTTSQISEVREIFDKTMIG